MGNFVEKIWLQRVEIATPQHEMEELLSAVVLGESSVGSAHSSDSTIRISGDIPPQKLKAVCSSIVAPGSTVKSVEVGPFETSHGGRSPLQCTLFEEMISAQKGGSCPALERLIFHVQLEWNGTSVERLGVFLQRTPSIKEIVFDCHEGNYEDMGIEESLAEKLADALCLNN